MDKTITGSPAISLLDTEDVVSVVDVDDFSDAPTGTNKKITYGNLTGSTLLTIVALETIPAYYPATATGKIADSNNLTVRNKVVGIALKSITNGFSGFVVSSGLIKNPAWTWTIGDKIFLNGITLSTVAPSNGFSLLIGVAIAADTINVQINESILL